MPLTNGQQLLFISDTGRIEKYKLIVNKTQPYEYQSGCYGSGSAYGCLNQLDINSFDSTGTIKDFRINYLNKRTEIIIKSRAFKFSDITPGGFIVDSVYTNIRSSYFTFYTIKNVIFSDVQAIMTDTLIDKTGKVYKIFLAKNKGLVGFETFPEKETWLVQ
jgi:hypothetical protein